MFIYITFDIWDEDAVVPKGWSVMSFVQGAAALSKLASWTEHEPYLSNNLGENYLTFGWLCTILEKDLIPDLPE